MFAGFFRLFSRYAHPFEKKVDRFFSHIKSTSMRSTVEKQLEELMQQNLVILNLWMEKKYKNYIYLRKGVRKKMYENAEVLKQEFLAYADKNLVPAESIQKKVEALGLSYPKDKEEELRYLATIMSYLKPGPHYSYQEGANFGKLLKNPTQETLIGDCNQIVTLYTFLFSLKYPISDLQIKILPGHVCLHFEDIDIEATNATFKKYEEFTYILPITEIISTNVLDVVDVEAKTKGIEPRTILKRSQFAAVISSNRELVERNLQIAYRNLAIRLMKERDYSSAIFYAEKLRDPEFLRTANRSASIFYLNQKNFDKAEYFGRSSGDPKLQRAIPYQRGAYYYNQKNYDTAIKYFRQIGDDRMVRACYQGQYNLQAQKVKHVQTIADAKKYRSTYQTMLDLANKAGNTKAADHVRDILSRT